MSEDVGDFAAWSKFITQICRAREVEKWKERMDLKPKLRLYRTLKSYLVRESYLDSDVPFQFRKQITQLRSGTNTLRIETGRWIKEPLAERICKMCSMKVVEDEPHFLLDCLLYDHQRLVNV